MTLSRTRTYGDQKEDIAVPTEATIAVLIEELKAFERWLDRQSAIDEPLAEDGDEGDDDGNHRARLVGILRHILCENNSIDGGNCNEWGVVVDAWLRRNDDVDAPEVKIGLASLLLRVRAIPN
jgi:hypothetical protein